MGTKKNQKFYERAWKRLRARGLAYAGGCPEQRRIEDARGDRETLPPERIAIERDLEGLCYAEYGFLTPNQRDRLFVRALNRAVAAYWPKFHVQDDGVGAELTHNWVNETLELQIPEVRTAVRNARQHYDALGLQYEPAAMWVVRQRTDYSGGHGLPRPNQVFSKMALDVLKRDAVHVKARFVEPFAEGPVDPRFLAENFVGHWAQLKALDAIEDFVKTGVGGKRALGRYLVDGLIGADEARRRFGEEQVANAIASHGQPMFESTGGAGNPPRVDQRACLGLSFDANAEVCRECPVKSDCIDLSERVRLAQLDAYGVEDPRAEFQRQDVAVRQRNARRAQTAEYRAWAKAVRDHVFGIVGLDVPKGEAQVPKRVRKKKPVEAAPR